MNITIMPVGMLGTNCYVLSSEQKNCIIVDPGAQPEKIAREIESLGLKPDRILLTHCHYDHIGGVNRLSKHFGGLPVFVGERDAEQISDPKKSIALRHGMSAEDFIIPEYSTVKDTDELELDELRIRVVETPGHTPGGVCYLCNDVMFSGDTLFHRDIGRCDLPGGDYDVMLKTLKKLAALEGDYTVYPGHGESTTLDHERQHNPYIKQ